MRILLLVLCLTILRGQVAIGAVNNTTMCHCKEVLILDGLSFHVCILCSL